MSPVASLQQDLGAIAMSGAYVLGVIAIAELFRKRGVAREHTRKIIHVGIGMWVIPTFMLFDHRVWAVAPAAAFVLFNYLAWQFGWVRSMEGERRNVGTILYPLSTALALALFWTPPWPVVGASSILVMCWGDAAAAIVGRRFGRTHYVVLDHRRSLEGSLAMVVMSVAAILVCFAAFGAPIGSGVVLAACIASVVASAIEAVCPNGLDNLLVPASVAVTLVITRSGVWG